MDLLEEDLEGLVDVVARHGRRLHKIEPVLLRILQTDVGGNFAAGGEVGLVSNEEDLHVLVAGRVADVL